MKSLMKIGILFFSLLIVSSASSQVRWGVDLRFGSPPPPRREIIIERPYPDAIWVPGYYNHYGYRYLWVPGYWRRPARFHSGWERRGWGRDHRNGDRREFDHSGNRYGGRDRFDHREGRIH